MSQPILTIVSENNAVELVLTDASVSMKLSESLLEEIRGEMRSEPELQQESFAGKLARLVTSSVDKMVSRTIEYPLADIASVEYADGKLVFTYNKKHLLSFEKITFGAGSKQVSALQSFKEDDARAFVAKFREAKAAMR